MNWESPNPNSLQLPRVPGWSGADGNDHRAVLSMVDLSRASYAEMWQNLIWATVYNVLAVPLAAGALGLRRGRAVPGSRGGADVRVHDCGGSERPAAAEAETQSLPATLNKRL